MSVNEYKHPYLDSGVFIGWLNREVIKNKDRRAIYRHIEERAKQGEYKIVISALTIAEVAKIPDPSLSPLPPSGGEEIVKYFESEFFDFVVVDRTIGEDANRLVRRFGLMGGDAVHLACALRAKCDVFLQWDRDFNKVTTPIGIEIEEPRILGQTNIIQTTQFQKPKTK